MTLKKFILASTLLVFTEIAHTLPIVDFQVSYTIKSEVVNGVYSVDETFEPLNFLLSMELLDDSYVSEVRLSNPAATWVVSYIKLDAPVSPVTAELKSNLNHPIPPRTWDPSASMGEVDWIGTADGDMRDAKIRLGIEESRVEQLVPGGTVSKYTAYHFDFEEPGIEYIPQAPNRPLTERSLESFIEEIFPVGKVYHAWERAIWTESYNVASPYFIGNSANYIGTATVVRLRDGTPVPTVGTQYLLGFALWMLGFLHRRR